MRHNDEKNMTPSSLSTKCVSFTFSAKSIVFLKMFQMSLAAQVVDYIFEESLNSHITVG